ncbi:MAG: oxygen-independent coproporphyrinogen III oxidase [Sphingomonadales bacterium]|nr:oxygen-independent coproporphyrinogen III oxidase [Sphingomonadales bacterium]MDE2567278.1 oxygen-independent coproporphyrinogen III oxidase [Sphingomonadales bacterium]
MTNTQDSTVERFAGWDYYPDLLATPVPRYTSYPTAAEFTDGDFASAQAKALRDLRGSASLYVHIPFCERICWYCGCNTSAANRIDRVANYLEALANEIETVSGLLDPSLRITRIALGGGSPNAITATDFVRLADCLTLHFRTEAPDISIEIDPRSLTPEFLMAIRGVGVTRASLGVQTLDPKVQAAIGRVQPREDIERAVEGLRGAGVKSLNFDLMYGLPFQTDAVLAETLDATIAMAPERIALFGYAHVPHMIARQRQIDDSELPGQRERFRMAAEGHARLARAGYRPIGFDHFALPHDELARAAESGTLRRNFQGFTEDQAPALIGLGASSISEFPGLLVQNEKNSGRYRMLTACRTVSGRRGVVRTEDDRRRGAVIAALLCQGQALVDTDLLASVRDRLAPFVERGLARVNGRHVALCPGAEPYARTIAALFDAYRTGPRQFSSAV